ncbi:MAG: transporter substrate-binding domain-containing protein [Synergistaceae bacterium]|nr:transporter substrate-binding domain-containing protein [Synergistaceae bacterium]
MNKNNFMKRVTIFTFFILLLFSLLFLAGRSEAKRAYPKSVKELNGLKAGTLTGAITDIIIEENFPDSKICYYNNLADLLIGLENNKIDYFLSDKIAANYMIANESGFLMLDESLLDQPYGFIFQKGSIKTAKLKKQLNEFIGESKKNGYLDSLAEKWFVDVAAAADNAPPLDTKFDGKNGVIKIAVSQAIVPFSFVSNGSLNGHDIEFLVNFCKKYGYGVEFYASDFDGIIPAVSSGKCDIGASCITITEERAKSVDFSAPYAMNPIIAIVMKKASGFSLSSIKDSFEKTFIQEDRWRIVLDGLGVTAIITIVSTIIGSLLGFCLYLIYRKGNRFFNKFLDAFALVYKGLPAVVILMILYYIIFAKSSLSGLWVSSIAFAISLGLSVYSMLGVAVKSIGRGQIEGAYSLGFTDTQTFFRIVLPQSMTQFLPNYKGALISLLQSTSIVGYIAVQDLTKVSDIIRSRTFEAFFPLIATALIYLFLVWQITLVIKSVTLKFNFKHRPPKQILKKFK